MAEWVVDAKKYAAGTFDVSIASAVDTTVKSTTTYTVAESTFTAAA
ncbi:MAG: hypothetical protein R2715_22095 [Ilumatobacteraceae bacterium]